MRRVLIYALCEPGTREIRYIGKTISLGSRLRQHLAYSVKQKSHLGNWLRGLSRPPEMHCLAEVPEAGWQEMEAAFIKVGRLAGFKLVNGTPGGEGGQTMTSEQRRRMTQGEKNPMFGRKHSEESKLKMSQAMAGKLTGRRLGKNHPSFGKSLSPEHRRKQSISGKLAWARRKMTYEQS